MNTQVITISIALLFAPGFAGGVAAQENAPTASASTDYQLVKNAIEQSIGWAIEKDFDGMFRLWDDNMFHFWLFADSQVQGLDNFKAYAERWKNPDFHGISYEFRELRITFSNSGDVAWYSGFLDDCYSYMGKEACLENVFQTGVLERKNGRWVHTQVHGSYPVDKVPDRYVRKFYSHLFGGDE